MTKRICSVPECGGPHRSKGFCSTHYARWLRTGGTDAQPRIKTVEERFVFYTEKPHGEEGCWLWTGSLIGGGYGQIALGHHTLGYAHIEAYKRFVGPIPEGADIDHVCHNEELDCPGGAGCRHRRCWNPAHLEAVPHGVNVRRGAKSFERSGTCRRGHDVTVPGVLVSNGGGNRICGVCRSERRRKQVKQ